MKKTLQLIIPLFFLGIGIVRAQLLPSQLVGDPNQWANKATLATLNDGVQPEGFDVELTDSKTSTSKPNNYQWRVKLGANGFIEFPELANLGTVTFYLAGGASTQASNTTMDYNTITIDKKDAADNWVNIGTAGLALPKAETVKAYTVTCNSSTPVKIRIFNASGLSIWVYYIEVTAFDPNAASDRLSYSFKPDMPSAMAGSVAPPTGGTPWHSALVDVDANGKLVYHADDDGFVLPDFSQAGYQYGNEPIPDVPVVKTISPIAGDNTALIQNAIDEVGALPLNSNGIRGALLLTKGLYEVTGPIYVNFSGVVVRGEGNGPDPASNTVVYDSYRDPDAKSAWRSVMLLGNKTTDSWNSGKNNQENILDDLVPVGARTIRINKNTNYQVGDLVCIYQPCTQAWLAAVNYGDVGDDPTQYFPWTTASAPIYYHRTVTKVTHLATETVIEVNAPVFYSLHKALSQSVVYRFNRVSLQHIGLENLRVDCAAKTIPDENHSWNCVGFKNADNCWARNVVAAHFGQAGFFTEHATAVTFEQCYSLDPVGIVTGERMYNFNQASYSQLILYKECYGRGGRHNFVSNGTSTVSGCVVYKCKSEASRTSSEGHRIWSQGMLFDSYQDFNPISSSTMLVTLGFYNRWNMGSGHGWAMAHGVMWNCNMVTNHATADAQANSPSNTRSGIYCEKPPTAQNYAIGCWVENSADIKTYRKTIGYVEGTNQPGLEPASLYEAQLNDRRVATAVPTIAQRGNRSCVVCNAANNALRLSCPDIIEQIDIHNLLGCCVYACHPQSKEVTLETSGLPKGILLVTIKTQRGVETHKVRIDE